jgi:hypothetical protein
MSPIRLRHNDFGQIELFAEKLHIAGAPGLALVVYHARPGTASRSALQVLADKVAKDFTGENLSGSPPRRVVA